MSFPCCDKAPLQGPITHDWSLTSLLASIALRPAAIPTTALIVTMLAVEFGIMHKKQSVTQALQAFFHVFWMALVGFAVVLAVAEATKPVASRYRPDYLQRCTGTYDPTVPANNTDWVIQPGACKGKDLAALADGKKSFPSGHSANTLSICW